jgi:hypothetical protein
VRATKRLSSVRRRASPHQHILNQFGESVQTCVPVTAFSARLGLFSAAAPAAARKFCVQSARAQHGLRQGENEAL